MNKSLHGACVLICSQGLGKEGRQKSCLVLLNTCKVALNPGEGFEGAKAKEIVPRPGDLLGTADLYESFE